MLKRYVCICIYAFTLSGQCDIYIYVCVGVFACVYACMYVCTCACVYVCNHVGMSVRVGSR